MNSASNWSLPLFRSEPNLAHVTTLPSVRNTPTLRRRLARDALELHHCRRLIGTLPAVVLIGRATGGACFCGMVAVAQEKNCVHTGIPSNLRQSGQLPNQPSQWHAHRTVTRSNATVYSPLSLSQTILLYYITSIACSFLDHFAALDVSLISRWFLFCQSILLFTCYMI